MADILSFLGNPGGYYNAAGNSTAVVPNSNSERFGQLLNFLREMRGSGVDAALRLAQAPTAKLTEAGRQFDVSQAEAARQARLQEKLRQAAFDLQRRQYEDQLREQRFAPLRASFAQTQPDGSGGGAKASAWDVTMDFLRKNPTYWKNL